MVNSSGAYTCLGVDLGASSGRVMAGWNSGGRLELEEIHRFENVPVTIGNPTTETSRTDIPVCPHLCWNFEALMTEIESGIRQGIAHARAQGRPVRSIGIDSWAVDFGLIDKDGQLLGPVVHYRDSRTDGQMDRVFSLISRERIFEITGIQFLPFNTIYQLAALQQRSPELLKRATHFMMIADLVAWRLTGKVTCEFTNATTTQLFDAIKGEWSDELITALDLPRRIFPEVTRPGETIGTLRPELARQWDAEGIDVIAVATHDTGSAVMGVPATEPDFAYLSCGTWSLLGTEVTSPAISPEALAANFTNEGGACGTFRLLKNIMGLWILQECRREWQRQDKPYSWSELQQQAAAHGATPCRIDVDDPRFLPPGDMPARIRDYCAEQGGPIPASDGEIAACILRSLAERYREIFERMESLTRKQYPGLHVVGGGVQNELLCQWTSEALGRPVFKGPVEATILGNIGMQMMKPEQWTTLAEWRSYLAESLSR